VIPGLKRAKSNLLLNVGLDMNESQPPNWTSTWKNVLLTQPSSASPVRFFFNLLENPLRNSQAQGGIARKIGLRSAA